MGCLLPELTTLRVISTPTDWLTVVLILLPSFPWCASLSPGGHSDLVLMREHGDYVVLGRTRDDAAASFQEAVVDVLVTKTVAVAKECRVKQILLAGGVASNELLRDRLVENSPLSVLVPEPGLCTDNAAMIAACGYYRFQADKTDGLDLDVVPSLKLT